jgi:hypothetical protein
MVEAEPQGLEVFPGRLDQGFHRLVSEFVISLDDKQHNYLRKGSLARAIRIGLSIRFPGL